MRIVIDARESGTTSGRYTDKLIEYLAKLPTKHEFVVVTKEHRVAFYNQITPNLEVVVTRYKEFTFGEQLGFMKQLKSLEPDLIHFPFVQQPILYRGPVVTTIQDLTTLRFTNPDKNKPVFIAKQQIYKRVIKAAAKKSKLIITPTEFVKQDVIAFTHQDPNKFIVTLESADQISDRPEPIISLVKEEFLLYVGRPAPHKNLESLVEAFVLLQKDRPNLMLVFAGKKNVGYQRLEDGVKLRKIKNVVFTGFVSEGHLRWLYEHCAAYVFPSYSEGFGLPSLEAMAHGAPVVSSNATCLPEVNGDGALYFDPSNVSEMANMISTVLNDSELRSKLIEKGYANLKRFSWKRMAEETLEVYEKALKS